MTDTIFDTLRLISIKGNVSAEYLNEHPEIKRELQALKYIEQRPDGWQFTRLGQREFEKEVAVRDIVEDNTKFSYTRKFEDGTEKSYSQDELDAIARERIIKSILQEVNLKHSARVGYHAEQVLNKKQFSVAPNVLSKIEAKIIQDKKYISRPYFKSQGDYEIFINPDYKAPTHWRKYPFIEKLILVIIAAMFGLIGSLLVSRSAKQSQRLKEERQDSQIKDVSDSVKMIQKRLDSLK